MKIRHLEKADFDQCIDLLQAFAHEIGDDTLIETHRDFSQIKRILVLCLCSGTSWVAEDEGLIAGMLLSFREPDLWRRNYLRIRELAWFVRPDYRKGSVAGRLFRAYQKSCEELHQQLSLIHI